MERLEISIVRGLARTASVILGDFNPPGGSGRASVRNPIPFPDRIPAAHDRGFLARDEKKSLKTVANPCLLENVVKVFLDGIGRNVKFNGNFLVETPVIDETKDFTLTLREAKRSMTSSRREADAPRPWTERRFCLREIAGTTKAATFIINPMKPYRI